MLSIIPFCGRSMVPGLSGITAPWFEGGAFFSDACRWGSTLAILKAPPGWCIWQKDTQTHTHTQHTRHRHRHKTQQEQRQRHTPKATTQTHRETHQKVRTKQAGKFLTVSVYKNDHLKLFFGLCGGDLSRDTRQSTYCLDDLTKMHHTQARRACDERAGNGAQTRTKF